MPEVSATDDGDALSTVLHTNSAKRLSRFYRKQEGLADDVDAIEVEGGELRFYIKGFFVFGSSTPIPYEFDKDLKPKNPASKRLLVWGTISGYIGKHLLAIRRKFSYLDDFKNLCTMKEQPLWYTEYRATFLKKYNDMESNMTDDWVFGVAQCIPIYRDNQYYFPDEVGPDGEPIYNPLHAIDGNIFVVSMMDANCKWKKIILYNTIGGLFY